MNRFKILKTTELKPCFAPVDPAEKTKKTVKKSSGITPSMTTGYTGMEGPSTEEVLDIASMHGVEVARTGLRSNPGRFR